MRSAVYVIAVLALVAMALVPAAPAEAIELGFDVRFSGVIQTVGTDTEAWVVGGQTLEADSSTVVMKLTEPVVAGLWADVAAKKQPDGGLLAQQITVRKEQARLRGVLTSRPEGIPGEWVIAGVTVMATEDTKTSTRAGELAVDQWVEAVMTEEGGVLTAHQILAIGEQDRITVSGEIQEIADAYWVVSSIKLNIRTEGDEKTLISGKPVVGLIAHAAAELQEDSAPLPTAVEESSLVATALRVAFVDRTALDPAVKFEGKVTAMSVYRPVRTITVETEEQMSYTVTIMPNTRIHQEKGLLMVDATVHVAGWKLPQSEAIIASEITVLESPEEGGEFAMFRGEIKALPAEGKLGEWMIGEQKVIINEQTQLLGAEPKVGAWAVGGGIERADGSILAGRLTVFAPRNLGTVTPPPWTPRPTRTPVP
jgi:hypothetical protein